MLTLNTETLTRIAANPAALAGAVAMVGDTDALEDAIFQHAEENPDDREACEAALTALDEHTAASREASAVSAAEPVAPERAPVSERARQSARDAADAMKERREKRPARGRVVRGGGKNKPRDAGPVGPLSWSAFGLTPKPTLQKRHGKKWADEYFGLAQYSAGTAQRGSQQPVWLEAVRPDAPETADPVFSIAFTIDQARAIESLLRHVSVGDENAVNAWHDFADTIEQAAAGDYADFIDPKDMEDDDE